MSEMLCRKELEDYKSKMSPLEMDVTIIGCGIIDSHLSALDRIEKLDKLLTIEKHKHYVTTEVGETVLSKLSKAVDTLKEIQGWGDSEWYDWSIVSETLKEIGGKL